MDIEYKYNPENISEIFDWPEPRKVIPEPPKPELFDLAVDPGEEANVADDHPDISSRMLTELETWFEEVESERQAITESS